MTKALICDNCEKTAKGVADIQYPWMRLTQTSFAGNYSSEFCSLTCLEEWIVKLDRLRADYVGMKRDARA